MPMSDQNLEETLIKISASLLSVQEQLRTLEDKPALNGAFDEICRQVKELHLVTHRIEDMLISSTTGEGLVMRVKELEGDLCFHYANITNSGSYLLIKKLHFKDHLTVLL